MSQYLDFVDLKYKPSSSDLVVLFRIEPAKGISKREAIGRVAAESSNGTWTTLSTLKSHIRKIRARAFEFDGNYVKVAYPIELFELGSIPQLMSSVAGNIFGMKAINNLRLEDIQFSKEYIKSFRGPQYGIEGIRKYMKIKERPMIATVPKPKVGLTTKEHTKVIFDSWVGGVDFAKDDENLTSQNFNKFENRVKAAAKARDHAEKITGEKKDYFINVSAETKEMLRRTKLANEYDFKYVMCDILTVGWSGLQTLREETQDLKQAIHAHRAFHAAFDRNLKHGMSMLTLAKLSRLIGVDNIHIGTVLGKLVGTKEEVIDIEKEIVNQKIKTNPKENILEQNWYNMRDVIPVSSGGLHPGLVPNIIDLLGKDIVIQLGGGIHGHPKGSKYGAMALRQAIDAKLNGISLENYSKNNHELKLALSKWGTSKPV
ncbi:type III ribulose-bisphosphate carboxylase [Candidatus Woesearchaeota archaeon]|uniref:Ribulose bisphosphate carboxylase n=1 Tax=uncultured Candidatus Woesearchaeota archaeon TaxID=2014372 RepID=A0A447IUJ6_9ARCH|nr:type III ribulose-bisphosphate carboxylase [Candidatus Woesearchaeota archaeon]VDS11189.1 RuBisCO long chain, Form III-b [uncultured Candidatus Woesearchaeota archaeon]